MHLAAAAAPSSAPRPLDAHAGLSVPRVRVRPLRERGRVRHRHENLLCCLGIYDFESIRGNRTSGVAQVFHFNPASHTARLESMADTVCPVCLDAVGAGDLALGCSHVYHEACLSAQLSAGRARTGLIDYQFLECGLCRSDISIPSLGPDDAISVDLRVGFERRRVVHDAASVKLRDLGLVPPCTCPVAPDGKCPRMPGGGCAPLSSRAIASLAMRSLAFYRCPTCDCAFFGGLRNCEDEVADGTDAAPPTCPACEALPAGFEVCKKHGREDIQWKCLWCCSPGE